MSDPAETGKTVLVLGAGGREHALAWKLGASPRVERLIVAPGNDAWPTSWERWADVELSKPQSFANLAERACAAGVDLAVIGPDNPLADGLADALADRGVLAFGPSAAAARIESSKGFAKEVMQAAGVPTARFFRAHSLADARSIIEELAREARTWGSGWVVKCDGLALGKGVRVCATPSEAHEALADFAKIGAAAAGSFVIEERLFGEEVSWMAFCDGKRCALLEPARDHKRLADGDCGPNTGGMGAFSPVAGFDSVFAKRIQAEVFEPVLAEMEKRGARFRGVLYAGLMVNSESGQYWVLEFNARFGDPEAQVLLVRMEDDLYPWCEASARGTLDKMPGDVKFSPESAVIVVGAAAGYPDQPERDRPIVRAEERDGAPEYFWAGVRLKGGELVTAGGRVFGAVGRGRTLSEACTKAYIRMKAVSFPGMQHRSDIGASGDSR